MTTILLDFFGTLVTYSPSRTEQGYHRSHAVLEAAGCAHAYEDWLGHWDAVSVTFDERADETGVEYSMREAYAEFAPIVGIDPDDDELAAEFLRCYLEEWSSGVRPIAGVPEMLGRLVDAGHRCVLVSNTHDAAMVRGHLDAYGILPHLDHLVTSVEVGLRKPRPEIYAAALDLAGADAGDALFVGDTFVADYVGPTAVGIDARLVVPDGVPVPATLGPAHRLRSILELEDHVTA